MNGPRVQDDGGFDLTVATANILSAAPADQKGTGAGANITGRMAELDGLFMKAGVHVVGVQEGRLSSPQTLSTENFTVHAAAAVKGNHGVQLWIAKKIERRLRAEVHVLGTNLIVAHGRFRHEGGTTPLAIVVAHAPHARAVGGADAVDAYFGVLDEALSGLPAKAHVIMLADMNATLGADRSAPDRVGDADIEPLNMPGVRLMEFITTHSLTALNTFTPQPPTFTKGGRKTRLDYVLVSDGLADQATGTKVRDDIDIRMGAEEDHWMVQTTLGVRLEAEPPFVPPPWRLKQGMLDDPVAVQAYVDDLAHLLPPERHWSLDWQLGYIIGAVRECAEARLSAPAAHPRKPWISAATWSMIRATQRAKATHRDATHDKNITTARVAFTAWTGAIGIVRAESWTTAARTRANRQEAWARWWLEWLQGRQRAWLRWDRRVQAAELAAEAAKAAERGDTAGVYRKVRRLTSYTPRAAPVICWENGSPTTSQPDRQRRWREHYAELFLGEVCDADAASHGPFSGAALDGNTAPQPIYANCKQDAAAAWQDAASHLGVRGQRAHAGWASPDLVEAAFGKINPNKALGPDMTSSALYQAAGQVSANQFALLMARSSDAQRVPAAWRGGRLVSLFKKGSARVCGHYRGLLVSDHSTKAATALIAAPSAGPVIDCLPAEQCGGVPGRGTSRALLFSRGFVEHCRRKKKPAAILFVDVARAFDTVLRQYIFGAGTAHGPFSDIVADLNLPKATAEAMTRFMEDRRGEGLMADTAVPDDLAVLIADLHNGSWFTLDDSGKVVTTRRGARQGCRFGGLMFSLLYASALRDAKQEVQKAGVNVSIDTPGDVPLWHHRGERGGEKVDLFDVTYADDEAIFMTFESWPRALDILPLAALGVEQAFKRWGFDINWAPGKTELLVIFTGRGAKGAEVKMRALDGASREIVFERPDGSSQAVKVVSSYKHVGSIVQASGGSALNTDAHARAARAAHGPLAKQLRSPALWPSTRISLLRSLVHSRLTHDLETVGAHPRQQMRKLQGIYVDTVRKALRWAAPSTEQWHRGYDHEVLETAAVPTLWSQTRRRRLRLAWTLLQEPQPQLAAIMEPTSDSPAEWSRALLDDLRLLSAASQEVRDACPTDPYDDPDGWRGMMLATPKATWERLTAAVLTFMPEVRTVLPVTVDTTAPLHAEAAHLEVNAADANDDAEPCPAPLARGDFICPDCPPTAARTFTSHIALVAHRCRAHDRIKSARFKIGPSLECPVCGCKPSSRRRLLVHATRSSCAQRIGELPLLPVAVLQVCDPDAARILESGSPVPAGDAP